MEGKFFGLFFTIFVFNIFLASASIVINEVMPNPASDWDGNGINETYNDEWIEIYNNFSSSVNLNNYKLGDKVNNYTISGIILCPNCFLVLYGANTSLQLNNADEEIYLYDGSGIFVDSHGYSSSSGDLAIGRCNSSGSWQNNLIPTPGAQNNCSENQGNSSTSAILFSYPNNVYNNETNFSILINLLNFAQGNYDLKIDIKNSTKYLNRVWTSEGWSSKNEWLENFISVNSSNQSFNAVNIVDNEGYFVGNATAQIKLKNSTDTFSSSVLNISILNGTFWNLSSQEESEITIVDAPDSAQFGETIDVGLNVYRGDTSKYAVYVYAEDDKGTDVSDKVILHFNTKFSNQTTEVELQLKCKNESGTYEIVAEGLDTECRKEIELDACSEDESENSSDNKITIGDFSYSLTVPNSINLDEEFRVKVKITSKASEEQNFLVWSYVYRSSKCYSCGDETRESNAKSITMQPNTTSEVELQNIIENAEPGDYKLKIKILQEGLKTAKEFTYDVKIESSDNPVSTQAQSSQNFSAEGITSNAVVESKSFSLRNSLPYLLATVCALLAIYIVIKKI